MFPNLCTKTNLIKKFQDLKKKKFETLVRNTNEAMSCGKTYLILGENNSIKMKILPSFEI